MSKNYDVSSLNSPNYKNLSGSLAIGILILLSNCSSRNSRRQVDLEDKIPATQNQSSYLKQRALQEASKMPLKAPPQKTVQEIVAEESQKPSQKNIQADLKLDLSKISKQLGVPSSRLDDQTAILANFLNSGHNPSGICSDDEDGEVHEHLCAIIDDYKNVRKKGNTPYSSSKQRRVPIRPHHFRVQQGFGYGRLVQSISRESAARVLAWSPRLLAQTSCPRNLSAAALRKIESLLPHPKAEMMMEKLYLHASACLQPDDEGYELTHFRQALLRKMWGNHTGAKFSIQKAVLATESSEKSRVLYWAGALQENAGKRKVYWDELVRDYPLSYHALEVWKEEKQDPLLLFASRPDIQLNAKNQNPDESVSQAIAWVEALYFFKQEEAAAKLSFWLGRNYKDQLTPPNKFYLSMLKTKTAGTNASIHFLTRQVANNPDILNEQTLKLLFPRPYYEIFDRVSEGTDTNLVLAVARQESGFNPLARSRANARGLLQLLPSTARMLTQERYPNLYNEETNATLGVKFLSRLIERFGSVEHALIAYNAGPGRVEEWRRRFSKASNSMLFLDLIPFQETRNYVSSILRNNYWYDRLYTDASRSVATTSSREQRSQVVSQLIKNHIAASKQTNRAEEETKNF